MSQEDMFQFNTWWFALSREHGHGRDTRSSAWLSTYRLKKSPREGN